MEDLLSGVWAIRQVFFQHFYGSGCSWSLPVRWVLEPKSLSFFSKCLSFSPEPLSFFQSTGISKIRSQIFGKMAVFCRKFAQKVPNIAFFRRASRKCARFWLIYSKNAENGMSFEIHLATITTGSLSFGLKNRWVFWTVEFFRAWVFSKMLKKSLP